MLTNNKVRVCSTALRGQQGPHGLHRDASDTLRRRGGRHRQQRLHGAVLRRHAGARRLDAATAKFRRGAQQTGSQGKDVSVTG